MLDPIPADRRADVARALEAAFPGQPLEAIARVPAGLSGAGVYTLAVAGRPYLLRLEAHQDALRDPARQHACMRIAAGTGVAPAVHHLDTAAGVAIADFVEGPPFTEVPRPARLAAVASTLRALHDGPAFPQLIGFFEGMEPVWDGAEALGTLPADVLAAHRAAYREVVAAYPADAGPLVASHNDLNPTNVVFDHAGRAWFVDWELAFAADPYVDLAGVGLWFCADADETDLVLTTYLGRAPEPAERARYAIMARVIRWFYGLMILGGSARERPGLRLTAADVADAPPPRPGEMATPDGRVRVACAFLTQAFRPA